MIKIGVILSSTRPGRFSEISGNWIANLAKARGDMEVELLDLREYPLPFLDVEVPPAYAPVENPVAQRWQKKLAEKDGFIVAASEYNRGPTGVMKNALDWAYNEWNRKAIAFVGHGSAGGARAIEQLRLNAVELQMAPVRQGVHIMWPTVTEILGGKPIESFDFLQNDAKLLLDNLAWWAEALKAARAKG